MPKTREVQLESNFWSKSLGKMNFMPKTRVLQLKILLMGFLGFYRLHGTAAHKVIYKGSANTLSRVAFSIVLNESSKFLYDTLKRKVESKMEWDNLYSMIPRRSDSDYSSSHLHMHSLNTIPNSMIDSNHSFPKAKSSPISREWLWKTTTDLPTELSRLFPMRNQYKFDFHFANRLSSHLSISISISWVPSPYQSSSILTSPIDLSVAGSSTRRPFPSFPCCTSPLSLSVEPILSSTIPLPFVQLFANRLSSHLIW